MMLAFVVLVFVSIVSINYLLWRSVMDTIAGLKQEVVDLKKASDDRELRDTVQDTVTAANITVLNEKVAALEAVIAAGGLTQEQQDALNEVGDGIRAVKTSLDSADPTPPIVP